MLKKASSQTIWPKKIKTVALFSYHGHLVFKLFCIFYCAFEKYPVGDYNTTTVAIRSLFSTWTLSAVSFYSAKVEIAHVAVNKLGNLPNLLYLGLIDY